MARYQRKSNTKKYLIATVLALLLVAASVFAWQHYRPDDNNESASNNGSTINLDPPTEEEQQAAEDIKDRLAETDDETATTDDQPEDTADKQSARVTIVDANQYGDIVEVRAFVSNHIQSGTCSYTFTQTDQNTIRKERPAQPEASTTVCMNLEVDRDEFPASGNWQLTVRYESEDAAGSSEAQTITLN